MYSLGAVGVKSLTKLYASVISSFFKLYIIRLSLASGNISANGGRTYKAFSPLNYFFLIFTISKYN